MRYFFDDFSLDNERRELCRGTEVIAIAPQVFDLLGYLIGNRERVVSKDDLISAIWQGRAVSDVALTTCLNAVRKAIGDSGNAQRLIKTFPRKGVRFVAAVREAPTTATVTSPLRPAAGKPSLVVLPFADLSRDPAHDYFVDGVTESLTTDLSRLAGVFVIGPNTAFTYKGRHVDPKQVGHELAALAHLGRIEDARTSVLAGLALDPNFSLAQFHLSSPTDHPTCLEQRERIAGGLSKAGLPQK